jgi:hypothetical protein
MTVPSRATLRLWPSPVGARITFEVAQPTDVEIAVLDGQDRIVGHLVAGVLAGEVAPPKPLQDQMAVWKSISVSGEESLVLWMVKPGGCALTGRAGFLLLRVTGGLSGPAGQVWGLKILR